MYAYQKMNSYIAGRSPALGEQVLMGQTQMQGSEAGMRLTQEESM